MITPPSTTPAFYVLEAKRQAAETLAAMIEPKIAADIVGCTVISGFFNNDIEPQIELAEGLKQLKLALAEDHEWLEEAESFNPMYIPAAAEELDELIDEDDDEIRFIGFENNPYAIKAISLTGERGPVIRAAVSYKPFQLPEFEDVRASFDHQSLN